MALQHPRQRRHPQRVSQIEQWIVHGITRFQNVKTLLPVIVSAGLLTGCANPFAQFYQDHTKRWPVAMQQRLLPPSGQPRVISTSNIQEDGRRLEEQGLTPVGFAGFRGGLAGQQQLIAQAKKVGADVVLYSSKFSHTEEGAIPIVSYQPGQTYTTQSSGTATANVYGTRGSAYASGTYSGTSTTTTPGTYSTEYVPYQRQVFEQGAVFWRHIKPGNLGVGLKPLPDDLRSKLQRNSGVLVTVVVQDSPAFRANILRGDVIIQVADKPVATVQELMDLLTSYAGQKISLRLIRDAQTIDVDVQLNQSQ